MKKIIALFIIILYSVVVYAQEGNLWKPYFERGIALYEQKENEDAEKQFRQSQQLLLYEFGLNESTYSTYCNILYRRAHNLYLIDDMIDSSYVCFKELYYLSPQCIDTISKKVFQIESMIMLSSIDLEQGNIRECCDLLEYNKQMIDDLDIDTYLPYKYYFYKNLAESYNYFVVNLLPKQNFDFLNSQYVIIRDGSFYNEYISVYKELVNLSRRFNSGNVLKLTEDLILLAEHCNMFYDRSLAESTFESAFIKWKYIENHNDITYLRLCKSYMSITNKTDINIYPFLEQNISKEFDSIIENSQIQGLSFIELIDFFTVRLQDESLNNLHKEKFVNEPCDIIACASNAKILFNFCFDRKYSTTLKSIDNTKILIKYLSLCAIYYYEQEENAKADLLLNKAKHFSLILPIGDRLLLREMNNAIAKSAEIIGDEDTYYSYKAINFTCAVARGMFPSLDEELAYYNNNDKSNRIANLKEQIKYKYDKEMIGFYLSLIEAYIDNKDFLLAEENIIIADSIIKLKERDGDVVTLKDKSDLLLLKAKIAYNKGETNIAIKLSKESNIDGRNIDAVELTTKLLADNRLEIDSIVNNQYKIIKTFIQNSYPFLTERQRIVYSQGAPFRWFSSIAKYADKYPYDTLLLSIAYNSSLICKGSGISVSTCIINNARDNNQEALDDYLQQNKEYANDTNNHVRINRHFYLEVLEKDMQIFSGISSQYLEKYFGSWEEISAKLLEDEVAIEFVEYVPIDESDPDNIYLGALYITKNNYPRIIRICNIDELDTISVMLRHDGLKGLSSIYDIIWQPILKEIPKVNKIWFSPSVHLFQINIESALPNIIYAYRVSSSRNVLTLNDTPDFSEIALFGGLNYDEDNDQKEEKGFANHTAYNIIRGSNIDEERVGLTYLKGSLNEVISAKNILSPINHNIQLFVDRNGTEACFKDLSGRGVSMLHIATHGFFINNSDTVTNIGNRVMRKSGLFMSGAKTIWKGGDEQYSGDDGILLSEEIENLDFRNLNLVVLSACGTGLGNPTNDGVYGLQRAFKKAGVQTIIMSLWNVDDNATALMMETFYKELVKTNSKHKAFHKAQSVVRELYEDPYYWASFIMLD